MGLTRASVGSGAWGEGVPASHETATVIALAGNPNVGKSSIFNALTGMHQHTGNWTGKTVTSATGVCRDGDKEYLLVDIPGTYSLLAHSEEEAVARNFLCFGEPYAVAVVCDATSLERGLGLLLQIMEVAERVILCVNLMDEAARKHVHLDLSRIQERLGIPVVGVSAHKKKSLSALLSAFGGEFPERHEPPVRYEETVERALASVGEGLLAMGVDDRAARFLALQLLLNDASLVSELRARFGDGFLEDERLCSHLQRAREALAAEGLSDGSLADSVVSSLARCAREICEGAIRCEGRETDTFDRRLDRVLTGRVTAFPFMILLLLFVFWLTISGANLPSAWLSRTLLSLEAPLLRFFTYINAPPWLSGLLVEGAYRVLAWVVSVMLPPMAIFFPLFTLLEDAGYLPRVAYNLDRPFAACHACGKQALTMCMGFGCNAAGVTGCRIIDSPRERLLAILTNSFVPCNGRFPTLTCLITVFFVGQVGGFWSSAWAALLLLTVILIGVGATLLATRLLSATLLSGVPSFFTLELPPYRPPQVGQVIVRSVFDRTLFVLGRAAAVAAPAGLVLWVAANVTVGGESLLAHGATFLDPLGQLMGLDGVILLAFILGFPANEIVLPIALMAYTAGGTLTDVADPAAIGAILVANGWTWKTATSAILFSLMHWPCSTTLLTVKKETGSLGYTALAALLPTAFGMLLCIAFTAVVG